MVKKRNLAPAGYPLALPSLHFISGITDFLPYVERPNQESHYK